MTEQKITVKTMAHMKDLEARGIIKPTKMERLAMMLIETQRELDRTDNAAASIMGAETKGEAADFGDNRPKRRPWSKRDYIIGGLILLLVLVISLFER